MAAQMKINKWQVEPATLGDIEVSIKNDSDGPRAEIEQGDDYVWIDGEDIPALIDALQAAAAALGA